MLDFQAHLLRDEKRTLALREAIRQVVSPDSIVLDIGSGSGILSLFACEAGARRIYAIERERSADVAEMLARRSGFDDRLKVIHGRSEEVVLPERADILVTETLGAFGLDEQILSTVLDARMRLLVERPRIIPASIRVMVGPVSSGEAWDRFVGFWQRSPYGFDLSQLSVFSSNTAYEYDTGLDALLSEPAPVLSVDLATFESPEVSGEATFQIARDGLLHGFRAWFDATLAEGISISNETPLMTSWHQVYLPLEQPLEVSEGSGVSLRLETADGKVWRWSGSVGSATFDQSTWLAYPPCAHAPK